MFIRKIILYKKVTHLIQQDSCLKNYFLRNGFKMYSGKRLFIRFRTQLIILKIKLIVQLS